MSRCCYHYKPQGFIQTCCPPIIAATNEYISSISCQSRIVNGQTQTTQSAFLLAKETALKNRNTNTMCAMTVQSTIQHTDTITNQLYAQLLQVQQQRYQPYQPYNPPVIPLSVIQLQMATANVGVPVTPITCKSGKGNQFVTK
jgi:hypothetical protein